MAMLSIVMPVYNTRPEHLERSVRSLLNQTYKELEILLVDDGSGEETKEKLKELAALDPRIHLIRQENAGASAARNTGIRAARGRYLTMMDSDDSIAPEAYEDAIRKLQKSGADVAVFGFREMAADGTTTDYPAIKGSRIALENLEKILAIIAVSANQRGGGYPWNKVWDLEKIGKAEPFEEGIFCYEDKLWCMQMYQKCRKVLLLPENCYTYYENAQSLSRGDSIGKEEAVKKRRSALQAYKRIREVLPQKSVAHWAATLFWMKTIVAGVLKKTL